MTAPVCTTPSVDAVTSSRPHDARPDDPRLTRPDDPRLTRIVALFEACGAQGYGEAINQLQHALQCARLAVDDGAPDSLVVAALLHDVGQFLDDAGNAAETRGVDAWHEETGAKLLSQWYDPAVTEPVRLHVAAKRYLCAVEPGYRAELTAASELSLVLQGGPMDESEVAAFREHPFFEQALRLRRFDDQGKRPNWVVPDLASYYPVMLATMRDS